MCSLSLRNALLALCKHNYFCVFYLRHYMTWLFNSFFLNNYSFLRLNILLKFKLKRIFEFVYNLQSSPVSFTSGTLNRESDDKRFDYHRERQSFSVTFRTTRFFRSGLIVTLSRCLNLVGNSQSKSRLKQTWQVYNETLARWTDRR